MIRILLLLLALNLYEWSKGKSEDAPPVVQGRDSTTKKVVERKNKLDNNSYRKMPELIRIQSEAGVLRSERDCDCRSSKVISEVGEKFTVELQRDGKVGYKNLKIPVKTTVSTKEGKQISIEKMINVERIELPGTPEAEYSISNGCWDFGLKLNVTPPPFGHFEMRWRWGIIPDPKWVQDNIARTEFKIPVGVIKVGILDNKNNKPLFKKGMGLPMAQMEAEAWNIFNDMLLRVLFSQMNNLVDEALGPYKAGMKAAVNTAAAGVPGFEGINGMEVEADYPRNVWPDLVYYNTKTLDPLWGSDGVTDFPDVLGLAIPRVFQDYYAHAPFAIVLMLLADKELGKEGISLSQIDCARLSGSQIGGKLGGLWEESKQNVNPGSWADNTSGGGEDDGIVDFFLNKLNQPLEDLLNYYCVGCWGYLFPRDGKVLLSSDYQAFSLTAYRALSRMFDLKFENNIENLPWPHLTGWKNLQKMRADRHIFFQINSPRETGCFEAGTSQIVWENRIEAPSFDISSPEGLNEILPEQITFIVWRRVVLHHDAVWDLRVGI